MFFETSQRLKPESFIFRCLNGFCIRLWYQHCVKGVHIRSYSGTYSYFPAFGLNTERCEVSLPIQSECGKIRTRITLSEKSSIIDLWHNITTPLLFTSSCQGEILFNWLLEKCSVYLNKTLFKKINSQDSKHVMIRQYIIWIINIIFFLEIFQYFKNRYFENFIERLLLKMYKIIILGIWRTILGCAISRYTIQRFTIHRYMIQALINQTSLNYVEKFAKLENWTLLSKRPSCWSIRASISQLHLVEFSSAFLTD